MYERILVPLDGSSAGEMVLSPVQRLARKASSALLLAQVVETNPSDVGPGFQQEAQEFARDYLTQVADKLKAAGLTADLRVRPGPVIDALLALAREERGTLIALSSHGQTSSPRVPYGGVAERLIRFSPVPLLVRPALSYPAQAQGRGEDIRRILVTTDGSDASWTVAPHAAELARLMGAIVTILTVAPESPDWLRNWTALFESKGVEVRALARPGEPVATILETAAAEKVDLIAMSTRGSSGGAEHAAGSVTRDVLRGSAVPLLITRA